jgi:hypothetical protein
MYSIKEGQESISQYDKLKKLVFSERPKEILPIVLKLFIENTLEKPSHTKQFNPL